MEPAGKIEGSVPVLKRLCPYQYLPTHIFWCKLNTHISVSCAKNQ